MDPSRLQALRESAAAWNAATFAADSGDPDRQPLLDITPSTTVTVMQAAVSPDCSYRLVKSAIDAAEREICFYIYNVSAEHLLQLLRDAKERGVHIRLMYDTRDTRDNEREKLQGLGVELKEAPSSGQRNVFPHCHQKFAVIDESILLLGSANWAGTSIPLAAEPGVFRKGNREWIVRIDDVPLARWFKGLFVADWDIPALEAQPGFALEEEAPLPEGVFVPAMLAAAPDEVFDIKQVNLAQPVTVTPIISPTNYFELMRQLIAGAAERIDIEQQYILAGGPMSEGLLTALAARRDDVEIRIIVSPKYRKVGETDNWERSVASLAAFGLEGKLRAMDLKNFTHLHNKGAIFDRQRVVVSSTNWSENSLARAREAGVVIDSVDIAGYFADVFDFDWEIAWDAADVPENLAHLFLEEAFVPGGLAELHPADLV
jgi:phosphatidylserine/phosphatidylglycerophosphate/cardiolipin synthase-like enzyme